MVDAVMRHFDLLDFVDKSKELGVDEKVAKYQARQIEQAIEIAVDTVRFEIENKELATKNDIKELELKIGSNIKESELRLEKEIEIFRKEIAQSSNKVIYWVMGLLIASGLIQHLLK